jgi:hypothetical protein
VFSLEGCVERGLLPHIAQINWDQEPHTIRWKRLIVGMVRALILLTLLISRFSGSLFAWLGWGLFVVVLVRKARQALRRRRGSDHAAPAP